MKLQLARPPGTLVNERPGLSRLLKSSLLTPVAVPGAMGVAVVDALVTVDVIVASALLITI